MKDELMTTGVAVETMASKSTGRAMKQLLAGLAIAFGLVGGVRADVVEYYHLDALGSVRAVTDGAMQVVERHDYMPFGEECTTGDCTSNPQVGSGQPRKFTGKERDVETGFDYFGARYYSPLTGRFSGIDPTMTTKDNILHPVKWNRYVYARNNPLRFVDPDGRDSVPQGWGGAGGLGAYYPPVTGGFRPRRPTAQELQFVRFTAPFYDAVPRRGPDYFNASLQYGWGAGTFAVNLRSPTADAFFGWQIGPGKGLSLSVNLGWILQGTTPSSARVNDIVGGWGASGGGAYNGPGAALVWDPDGWAVEAGYGFGIRGAAKGPAKGGNFGWGHVWQLPSGGEAPWGRPYPGSRRWSGDAVGPGGP
jgi:RHS repeat-associated protein